MQATSGYFLADTVLRTVNHRCAGCTRGNSSASYLSRETFGTTAAVIQFKSSEEYTGPFDFVRFLDRHHLGVGAGDANMRPGPECPRTCRSHTG